jgi:AraC-like DNA-binding protein
MPADYYKGAVHPARTRHFVAHDIDEATEHFAACGFRLALQPLGARSGRIEFNAISRACDGMFFFRTSFEEPVEIRQHESFDGFQIVMPLSGSTTIMLGEDSIECARSGAILLDMREVTSTRRSARSENYTIQIEQRLLTHRLFELTGAPVLRRLRFTPQFDAGSHSSQALRAFLSALDRTMLLPAIEEAPHSAGKLSALLIDLLLEMLPHNYRDALSRHAKIIVPKHVRRAIDCIERHADGSLALEELVTVSGVSLRALQYGFQKFLGVSISEYERSVRLDRARRDIERNPGERIAVVAKRWNFSNFTRFNTQFEAAFGISAVALRASRNQHAEQREASE